MKTRVSRNLAEVERSASEASKIVLKPVERSETDRYLAPPADTPFALEYAFHLLGDVRGKAVLDLGCGSGGNVVVLAERGAQVVGIDISPDLFAIAQQRARSANLMATVKVGDAYNTGLPDESVDVIFCIALIHHLDIRVARDEMWRVLRKGGTVILKEPIRFSAFYARVRNLLPAQEDISEYEHPLTQEELSLMTQTFQVEGTRFFRLPFVPLFSRLLPSLSKTAWKTSDWIIRHFPPTQAYATAIVTRLQK
ncbi:MAG TPA: methyltransferase domain-containing protein [Candidatus Acidoferrum sp.]|nr:methyltransferase domain-containing protein [Candidatus Acidoferrum sp.]